jgi:predicted glycosyltransferase
MKILIDMGHPAHVHLFKNFVWGMKKRGHEVLITARKKEISLELLDKYGFDYITVGEMKRGKFNLMKEWILRDIRILKLALNFNPDILIGMHNPAVSHVAKILRRKSIIFTDTEHAKLANWVTFPFADVICTPSCFKRDLGKKQIRYNGYHELAYLNPTYFTPNPAVLDEIGLSKDDTFIILRFVSWGASHDVGHSGLTIDTKRKAVKEFEKYGHVFITSESPLSEEFERYRIAVSPEKIHDLMYYATLLYGESATMASECAVLGTHAIFSDFAGRGYTNEEEEKYGLVFNFKLDKESQRESLEKAVELLENNNLKNIGEKKREKLLKDKIDVTAFMVWFVENYPESFKELKKNLDIQRSF